MIRYPFTLFFICLVLLISCSSPTGHKDESIAAITDGDNISMQIGGRGDDSQACPSTPITISLPEGSYVDFWITSATGYHIRTLIDHEYHNAGAIELAWDFNNDKGTTVYDGFYLFNVKAGYFTAAILYFVRTNI